MDDKENSKNEISRCLKNNIPTDAMQQFDNKFPIMEVEPEPLTTKIYYFVDDQAMPYSTEIPVPPSKITLSDFKKFITRRNYKYYLKVMDSALNSEVKAEIRDEFEALRPDANGRFEIFLLSENPGHDFLSNAPVLPQMINQYQHRENRQIRAPLTKKKTSTLYPESKIIFAGQDNPEESQNQNRLFADSNFASSLSDGDSQYTTTDFTSVSQQNPHRQYATHYGINGGGDGHHHHNNQMMSSNRRFDGNNKPYWTREKRKRYRRSPPPSFLSSTFEDTEISMALDLITVTFNMDSRRPFGMSVVVKRNRAFYGIVVHEVVPNSLVALDGRIKPGYILLEINGIPLDEYDSPEDSVTILSNAVRNAIGNRGQLKLTCARGEIPRPMHTFFRPPVTEPVRPIDPTAWVQHTNAARGLNVQNERGLNVQEFPQGFEFSNAYLMSLPKSATLPKIGTGSRFHQLKANHNQPACDQSTSPMKRTGLKMIQNPSTEITTTSGHSSMECSIGNQLDRDGHVEIEQKPTKSCGTGTGGGHGRGRIGTALRRLVCILTNKRGSTMRKRKANSTKRSSKK